ncbi:MAG: hypothetical protein AAF641_06105 [Pseudomonadota bacterium]
MTQAEINSRTYQTPRKVPLYEAVNAAQRTAWSINPFILTILNMAWDRDYSLGGIPQKNSLEEPPKTHDIDTNEEARKEWRKAAHQVIMENREIDGKRISFLQTLNTANRYQLFPALYMPYQLDFRGRIYAVPRLNPQGTDWMKALLQFSEGKPLDEDSAVFLAIQVANTGAFDKIDKAPSKSASSGSTKTRRRSLLAQKTRSITVGGRKQTVPTASWLHAVNGPDGYMKVTVLFPTFRSPLTEVVPVSSTSQRPWLTRLAVRLLIWSLRTKGNKFQVDVTVKGVRAPRVSFDTLAEAQKEEARFKAHLLAGGDPAELTPDAPMGATSAITLAQVVDATIAAQSLGRPITLTA